MSKSRRDGELGVFKKTPGVGEYNHESSMKLIKPKTSEWRVGSEKRPNQQ